MSIAVADPRADSGLDLPAPIARTNPVAKLDLQATSLYFACMANGTSRMYHSDDLKRCVAEAGLELVEESQILFHTVYRCKAR